jgi:outer membrane protein OmpA-like peptidoglycan-associated protein
MRRFEVSEPGAELRQAISCGRQQGGFMNQSRNGLIFMAAMAVIVTVAAPGCATKKYVNQQIAPVNQRVDQYHQDTSSKIAWLNNKQEKDISQVNERISTTDQHVAQVSNAAQAAQATASRAMQAADANKVQIEANAAAITNVANSLNYQLVEQSDVWFAFDKSTLTDKAKAELDAIAGKALAMPRSVIELSGFTDPVGSKYYNLDLSRRRAWAVERYLVQHNVPARSINVIGFGKEPFPKDVALSAEAGNAPTGKAETHHLERRVRIQLYGAGSLTNTAPTPTEEQ